jgi:hypothetical protein
LVARHLLLPGSNPLPLPDGRSATATLRPDGAVVVALPDGGGHEWGPTADGGPYFHIGAQRFELLRQSDKVAIRVRDPDSPARAAFQARGGRLEFFPPDARFRVHAWLRGEERTTETVTGLGARIVERIPGTLHFAIGDRELTLDPVIEADAPHRLFLNFRDETSGKETYGAGRFLYLKLPDADGRVLVDFNQAFNPPCALTEHASCPIAPPQNRLPIRVEAGERDFAV